MESPDRLIWHILNLVVVLIFAQNRRIPRKKIAKEKVGRMNYYHPIDPGIQDAIPRNYDRKVREDNSVQAGKDRWSCSFGNFCECWCLTRIQKRKAWESSWSDYKGWLFWSRLPCSQWTTRFSIKSTMYNNASKRCMINYQFYCHSAHFTNVIVAMTPAINFQIYSTIFQLTIFGTKFLPNVFI